MPLLEGLLAPVEVIPLAEGILGKVGWGSGEWWVSPLVGVSASEGSVILPILDDEDLVRISSLG